MTNKEKRNILILLIVSMIIVIVLRVWAHGKEKEREAELASTGETTGEVTGNVVEDVGGNIIEEKDPKEEIEEYVQVLADGSKLNISDNVAKDKIVDGLVITNIQLKEKEQGTMTTLIADVENKTNKKTEDKMIKIEVIDKTGKVITTATGFIDPIEAGGKGKLNMGVTGDVSNAYDIRISKIR